MADEHIKDDQHNKDGYNPHESEHHAHDHLLFFHCCDQRASIEFPVLHCDGIEQVGLALVGLLGLEYTPQASGFFASGFEFNVRLELDVDCIDALGLAAHSAKRLGLVERQVDNRVIHSGQAAVRMVAVVECL